MVDSYVPFEVFWPLKISQISGEQLRQLDDDQFAQLKRLVRDRELRLTGNPLHAASVSRKLELRRRPQKRVSFSKAALLASCQPCEILSTFVPDRERKWKRISRRQQGSAIDVRDFSFIDNPISTFEILREIARGECDRLSGISAPGTELGLNVKESSGLV